MDYELNELNKFRNFNLSAYIKNILVFLISFLIISFYYNKIFTDNSYFNLIIVVFGLSVYVLSLINIKKGVYFFIFLIPLFGSLPKILNMPEIPVILFLFFFLFLGFILKRAKNHLYLSKTYYLSDLNEKSAFKSFNGFSFLDSSFKITVFLFCTLAFISAAITIWRYSNFLPLITKHYYNFKINILGQRSTEAIYWTVKCFFNYIVGFGFLYVVCNVLENKKDILKALSAVLFSIIIVFVVFLYQLFVNPMFGNFQMWVDAQRFNSTFSDPNSLGNFIIIAFPVLLGLLIYLKKWWQKVIILMCIVIILILFLFAGSRNAFLGVFLSIIIFIMIFLIRGIVKFGRNIRFKLGMAKTIIIILLISIIIISALISPFYFIKRGGILDEIDKPKTNISLINRMVSTIWMSYNTYVLADFKEAFKSVSSFRYALWNQAIDMSLDYPVTGVGVGSFILELPNYYERNKSEVKEIDYTGNYYLQLMSELGIPSLLLILFIFFIIIKESSLYLIKYNNWLLIGFFVSFTVMVLILFLGTHTNFFEILFYFYLLIGFIFVLILDSKFSENKDNFKSYSYKISTIKLIGNSPKNSINMKKSSTVILFIAVVMIYLIIFFLVSFNEISIANKQNNYGIDNNFGFYEQERVDGFVYRWTAEEAGLTIHKEGSKLIIPLKTANPEIKNKNVVLNIFINNKKVKKVIFTDNEWRKIQIDVSGYDVEYISIIFSCNRSWSLKSFGLEDSRKLGVAVGEIKFLD